MTGIIGYESLVPGTGILVHVCNARTWETGAEKSQVTHFWRFVIRPCQEHSKAKKDGL